MGIGSQGKGIMNNLMFYMSSLLKIFAYVLLLQVIAHLPVPSGQKLHERGFAVKKEIILLDWTI